MVSTVSGTVVSVGTGMVVSAGTVVWGEVVSGVMSGLVVGVSGEVDGVPGLGWAGAPLGAKVTPGYRPSSSVIFCVHVLLPGV